LIASPASLPAGVEGTAYGPVTFAATGGTGGYAWTATGMPNGMWMSLGGTLGGTPASGSHGGYTVQVTVTDAASGSASESLPLTVEAPTQPLGIGGPAQLSGCTEQVACGAQKFSATGGTPPYTWSASGLPAGMTLAGDGTLSGTPAKGSYGSYNLAVTVQDSAQHTATRYYGLTVNAPLQITGPASLAAATVGSSYGPVTFSAAGGTTAYSWQIAGGALPSGLGLSSSGSLSGTPGAGSAGSYTFMVQVSDGISTAQTQFTLSVQAAAAPLAVVSPKTLPAAAEMNPYGPVNFTATGGSGGYVWSASGLPAGVGMSGGGVLSGTPGFGSAGSYAVQAAVRDSSGASATASLTLVVNSAPGMAAPYPPASAAVNVPYGPFTINVTGGVAPYTFSALSGFPSGIGLSSGGVVSGTPAPGSQGSYNPLFRIADSLGSSTTAAYSLTVSPDPSPLSISGPATLPNGREGAAYGPVAFSASGGTGTLTWSATGLPAGLTLASTGVLSGTPAAGSQGTYTVNASVHDAYNRTASVALALVINVGTLAIGPATLPPGMVGVAYGPVALTATGGTAPYTWAAASGLPSGLTLSSGGILSGTPAAGAAGTYTLAVSVRDAGSVSNTASWTLTIQSSPLAVAAVSSLPLGREGVPYAQVTFAATGGSGGYTWSASGLPAGLSLSAGGVLSGTPATGSHGLYGPQISVRDSSQNTATASLTLAVYGNPALAFQPPLPPGQVGVPYNYTLTATAGMPPYTWTAGNGLPSGLALSSGGVLSGTPAAGSAGSYGIAITIADAQNYSLSTSVGLTIAAAAQPLAIATPASLPAGTELANYPTTVFTATGGSGGYVWTATGLPAGLSVSTGAAGAGSGIVSGTPAAGTRGSYTVQLTVRDSSGATASLTLGLTIQPAQAFVISSPVSLGAWTELSPCAAVSFTANGGTAPFTWSATGLPAGVTLSASGQLSGTPAAGTHGSYTVGVTVQDAGGRSATASLPLTVNPPVQITGPAALPPATVGMAYGPVQIAATGGTKPFIWSTTGTLPPGLGVDINGLLSGTPAAGSQGAYSPTVQVRDFFGSSSAMGLNLTVQAAPSKLSVTGPATLPEAKEQTAYGPVSFTAAGGAGGYTWSATGLPTGLTMYATGALSGTPAAGSHGTYPVTFTVTDMAGNTASTGLTLGVAAAVPAVPLSLKCTPAAGPAQAGLPYSASCAVSGGTPPYNWSLAGTLPAGLVFNPQAGTVSGVPSAAGAYNYTIMAADASFPALAASQTYAGSVQPLAFSVTPGSLAFSFQPGSTVPAQNLTVSPGGFAFTVTVGGAAGCPWLQASPLSGDAPAQIAVSVNPAGLNPGSYNCNLAVVAGGSTQNVFATFTVAGATLTADPAALTFTAAVGGAAPSSQSIAIDSASQTAVAFTAASNCAWMSVSPTSASTPGTLTVSAQAAGLAANTYTCAIAIAAPSAGSVPQPTVTLRVNPASLTTAPPSISLNATAGSTVPLTGNLSLTGPQTPVSWAASVTAGTGGNWLSLGALSGTTPANLGFQANPSGLGAGTYSATVHVISGGVDTPVPAVLTVAPVTLRAVPASLGFHFQQGTAPAGQVVSVLSSDGSPASFTFQTAGHIVAAAGPGAGNVTVSVAPGLGAGTYSDGSLTVAASGASGAQLAVAVGIVVDAAPAVPQLTVSPGSLAFSFVQGTPAAAQLLLATNQGGSWTPSASVSTSSGGAWLALAPLPASGADGAAVAISAIADPSQAPGGSSGVYTGEVVVSNAETGQAVHVPVSMTVNPLPAILLSRQGLSFTAVEAGGEVPGDTLDVVNLGLGGVTWTATAGTRSGGGWLQVTQVSGTCAAGSPAAIGVTVNTAAVASLAPGTYYGWVEVRATDSASGQEAANSPQTAAVVLNVLAPATQVGPSVRPGTLIFSGAAGAADVPAQTVTVFNPNVAAIDYTSAAVTDDGAAWCTLSPAAGAIAGSASLAVQVAFGTLGAGAHSCSVQISFSDGSSQTVGVLAVVPASGSAAAAQVGDAPRATGCTASGLVVALREPAPRAMLTAFQPAAIEVEVRDGCGNPVDGAATSIGFSTGDDAIAAMSVGGGIYRAAWTPTAVARNVPQTDAVIQAAAQAPVGQRTGTGSAQPVHVTVRWNAANPVLISPGGVVDPASYASGAQVAPCGWIAIFGENLADGGQLAGSAPLPLELQGASVWLGGRQLPLRYVSAGQINAQVSCGIQPDSRQDLVVVHGTAQSVPASVVVATAQPAIFTVNQRGSGQAAAFWTTPGGSYVAADASNPVSAGAVVEIYCEGLGPAIPAVAEGSVAPANPLAWTALPVTATIGGQPAQVQFSGLMPGGVGVYQVNVAVPAGVPAGDRVPAVITVDGHGSQPGATVAVR
jgi:uncharacterized protein (TIGR03437 family)